MTRALCDRVGPSGRVTAVDLNTRFLDEIAADNLEVQRRDLVAEGIPGGDYDLVHARLLLMHLPTREKFLDVGPGAPGPLRTRRPQGCRARLQVRPLILAAGATEAQLDEMARLMDDPTQWFHHFAIYSVRGRAPER